MKTYSGHPFARGNKQFLPRLVKDEIKCKTFKFFVSISILKLLGEKSLHYKKRNTNTLPHIDKMVGDYIYNLFTAV